VNCPQLEEVSECDMEPCPYQCVLHDWENVGECEGECGRTDGEQKKIRRIKKQGTSITNCPSETSTQRMKKSFCKTKDCPKPKCQYETQWGAIQECPSCGFGNYKTLRRNLIPNENAKECDPWIEKQEQCPNLKCEDEEYASYMYILDSTNTPNYLKYYPHYTGHAFQFGKIEVVEPSLIVRNKNDGKSIKVQPSPGLDVTTYKLEFQDYKKLLTGTLSDEIKTTNKWYYKNVGNHDGNNGYKLSIKYNDKMYYLKKEENPRSTGSYNDIISSRGNNFTMDVNKATNFYFTKPQKVDCAGKWSECVNGSQTYVLTQKAYKGGLENCNRTGDTRKCEKETAYLKPGMYKFIFPHYENFADATNDKISKLGSTRWDNTSMYTWHWATKVNEITVNDSFKFNMQLYGKFKPFVMTWNTNEKTYRNGSYILEKVLEGKGGIYGEVSKRWWFRYGGSKNAIVMIIPVEEYDEYVSKQPNKDKIAF
tara:strand:+ start:930 stop:2369 length:1440 start_codon:yes stop_codon:yes gene_type:complete